MPDKNDDEKFAFPEMEDFLTKRMVNNIYNKGWNEGREAGVKFGRDCMNRPAYFVLLVMSIVVAFISGIAFDNILPDWPHPTILTEGN